MCPLCHLPLIPTYIQHVILAAAAWHSTQVGALIAATRWADPSLLQRSRHCSFARLNVPIHFAVTGATPAASAASHHAPGLSKKLGVHGGLTKRAAAAGGLRTLTGSKPAGVCGMSGPAVSSASSGSLGDGGSSAAGFSKEGGISAATAGGTGGGGLMMLGGAAYRVAGLRRPGPRRCQ